MAECEIDLRVGGKYRYVWTGPNGFRMGLSGEYREIVAPERYVATEVFDESWYPGEAIDTCVLTEQGNQTLATTTVLYQSPEAREAVLTSGMERGVSAGYDNLDTVLASMHGPRDGGRALPHPRRSLRGEGGRRAPRAVGESVAVR